MYILYKDSANLYRWRFVATNGKTIADSGESYYNKSDCLNGIALMKGSANAQVVDKTTQSVGSW